MGRFETEVLTDPEHVDALTDVTQIYAEVDHAKAIKVAEESG